MADLWILHREHGNKLRNAAFGVVAEHLHHHEWAGRAGWACADFVWDSDAGLGAALVDRGAVPAGQVKHSKGGVAEGIDLEDHGAGVPCCDGVLFPWLEETQEGLPPGHADAAVIVLGPMPREPKMR